MLINGLLKLPLCPDSNARTFPTTLLELVRCHFKFLICCSLSKLIIYEYNEYYRTADQISTLFLILRGKLHIVRMNLFFIFNIFSKFQLIQIKITFHIAFRPINCRLCFTEDQIPKFFRIPLHDDKGPSFIVLLLMELGYPFKWILGQQRMPFYKQYSGKFYL